MIIAVTVSMGSFSLDLSGNHAPADAEGEQPGENEEAA